MGRVEPVSDEIACRAAQLRARHELKLPDALVIATAMELGAHEILTFDHRWRSLDRRVRILGE